MFGDKLKKTRKNKGLTLEQLSEIYNSKFEAGLNKGTLSKYENNKQEPMISVVVNLAYLLQVSLDYLLTDSTDLYSSKNLLDSHETKVITAYHNQPEMQPAIDRLLGVEKTESICSNDTAKLEISEELSPIDEKIEQQVEEYRRSLEAEQKRKELSAYYASNMSGQKDSTKKAN